MITHIDSIVNHYIRLISHDCHMITKKDVSTSNKLDTQELKIYINISDPVYNM